MTDTHNFILVAFDGSPDSEVALAWAARTAVVTGRTLRAMVVEPPIRRDGDPTWELVRDEAERQMDKYALTEHQVKLVRGPIVASLLHESRSADLVVVGNRGHGRWSGKLAGSVSQHLAQHVACPVVVVPVAAPSSSQRIICGVDGSEGSAVALEFACVRAEQTGEPVVALYGWRSANSFGTSKDIPAPMMTRIEKEEAFLARFLERFRAAHPDVALEAEAIPVAAARALADASCVASLIVVGSRGHGAFAGMLLGSVGQHLLHHAQCPVAIVR